MTTKPAAFPLLEFLASFVHGGVAFGNLLGILFNVARGNRKWALIHAVGVALHVKATLNHAREVKRELKSSS